MLPHPLVSDVFERRQRPSSSIALMVAVATLAVGFLWVIVTDVIAYHVIRDSVLLARVQTLIDLVFIVLASVVLFFVAQRFFVRSVATAGLK